MQIFVFSTQQRQVLLSLLYSTTSALKFSFGCTSATFLKVSSGPHEKMFDYPFDYRLDQEALASDNVNLNLGWIY